MLAHHVENTFQLTHLNNEAIKELASSFDRLPNTQHADGHYRLRRYSVVRLSGESLTDLHKNEFMQTQEINHFQGDVVRRFEPIEDDILHSAALKTMCDVFAKANQLDSDDDIEIHQMRIAAVFDVTQISPEGIHRDGFKYVAFVRIDCYNIEG